MTDRELIELAAKAAGISGSFDDDGDWLRTDDPIVVSGMKRYLWMPLHEDGDALRLAMTLELGVVCKRGSDPYEKNRSVVTDPYRVNQLRIVENHNGDPEAATRRAIVRAAAEIGKSMEKSQ